MLLFSRIDAGQLYQAAFKSPEHLLSYLQSSILHDDLTKGVLLSLSSHCQLKEEQHSYALFSDDASAVPNRVRFVQRNCSLSSGGISVGLRGGTGFSFSISDSLFDLDILPLDDPEGTLRHALPWLLVLQLPIVKMYNSAVYERLLTRLYWQLANNDSLLSAAMDSHLTKTCTFVQSDFKHHEDIQNSDNPSFMQTMYPGLNEFCCRKNNSDIDLRIQWVGTRLVIDPSDSMSKTAFACLARQQLYYTVPAARNYKNPKLDILFLNLGLDFDDASCTIFDGISPENFKLLKDLTATHSPRSSASGSFILDTSGIDFAYLHDTSEDSFSQKRYALISKIIDHALLSQLRRNDCFQRHVKYSLSGIFGLDTPATKDLSDAFSEHLRGWQNKAKYYPFYTSLDPDYVGTLDAASVSWSMPNSDNPATYAACMERWLTTFSVDHLLKRPISEVIRNSVSALNLTVPSMPFLVTNVWKTNSLSDTQKSISASMLTSPNSRRDEKPYFASYVSNLALAVSEYFHSVYAYKTFNGDDSINVSDFSAVSSLTVPLLRLLCEVGLIAVPIRLQSLGQFKAYVREAKDIILVHTPRLLRYLSQDGYLGIMTSGISSTLKSESSPDFKTTKYLFGWDRDSLFRYRTRLHRLHLHVMPIVFGGTDKLKDISPSIYSDIIGPLSSYDRNNDTWVNAEPPFKATERFLALSTPRLYRHLRQNCASNIGGDRSTICSYNVKTFKDKTSETPQQRKKRLSRRNRYEVHELSHFLPLGRELKVKLIRKGFDVFVHLPWEDLFAWYSLLPPKISAAYRSAKLSKVTLNQKINNFANCKKHGWGLYYEYRERLLGHRPGSPNAVFDEWDIPYDGEQLRLNTSVIRLFKDIGFVFPLKTLLSATGNWELNGKPIDHIPEWGDLVSSWGNYSFSVQTKIKKTLDKASVREQLKAQYLAEYEANLKLPKRERKDLRIRFTEEEDLAIMKYYRRDMTLEDEATLRKICHRHDAFGVACRANKLAEKLIKEYGITDVKQLPLKRVGKKLHVMLQVARKS